MSKLSDRLDSFCKELTILCRETGTIIDVHGNKDEQNPKASPLTFFFSTGKKSNVRITLVELMKNPGSRLPFLRRMGLIFAEANLMVDRGQFEAGYPMVVRDRKWRKQICFLHYEFEEEEEIITYHWDKEDS